MNEFKHLVFGVHGIPEPVIKIYKDDRVLEADEILLVQKEGNYQLSSSQGCLGSGLYKILASNVAGDATCQFLLTIQGDF